MTMLSAAILPFVNLIGESTVLLAAFLLVATGVGSARLRLTLIRCAFAVAIFAPLVMVSFAPSGGLLVIKSVSISASADPSAVMGAKTPGNADIDAGAGFPGPRQVVSLAAVLLGVWMAGALVIGIRMLLSLLALGQVFARAAAPPREVQRRLQVLKQRLGVRHATLRISDAVPAPCTFGWYRPKILMPNSFLSQDFIDAVIAHELCHVRNRDAIWLAVGRLAGAIHWFNPLIWMCLERHRNDLEIVCDDTVTERELEVEPYVNALLQAVLRLSETSSGLGRIHCAAAMNGSGIIARVRILIDRDRPIPRPSRSLRAVVCGAAFGMLALCATTNLLAVRSATPTAPRTEPASSPDSSQSLVTYEPKGELGILYLEVPREVVVWAHDVGFMCSGGSCKASIGIGTAVSLVAGTSLRGHFSWSGCAASKDLTSCTVKVSRIPARVRLTLKT
jgi:beta-lactamase regulating signal transducer with metallopeptidase domain